jgi:hypothetical protein
MNEFGGGIDRIAVKKVPQLPSDILLLLDRHFFPKVVKSASSNEIHFDVIHAIHSGSCLVHTGNRQAGFCSDTKRLCLSKMKSSCGLDDDVTRVTLNVVTSEIIIQSICPG